VPETAARIGEVLASQLREVAAEAGGVVREVRGKGLMIGVELKLRVAPIITRLQESGLLALRSGLIVLRILPPYLITEGDVEFFISVLRTVLHQSIEGGVR
ncbi:MAG: aminotransferase class III-fold pyridoxal phosphate-dependent enzyme, partial [Nitrososphaerota archaeon]